MKYVAVQQTKEERDINVCYGCYFYTNHFPYGCKQPENIILNKGKFCYDITNGVYKIIPILLSDKIKIL